MPALSKAKDVASSLFAEPPPKAKIPVPFELSFATKASSPPVAVLSEREPIWKEE